MNGWLMIILGLLFVGVGGFLGFYGAQLNNRADNDAASAALNAKIGEVLTKIAEAQSAVPNAQPSATNSQPVDGTSPSISGPETAQKQLATIKQDFAEWASRFLQNKPAKKLELDRLKSEAANEGRRIGGKCRPIFQYAIEVLKGSVAAYNATAGTTYNAALNDLPDNLYDTMGDAFDVGSIEFSKESVWRLSVNVYRPPRDASPPVFFIVIPNPKPGLPSDNFRIEVRPDNLLLQTGGGGIAGTANVDSTLPIASYQPPLRTALERLLEAQITSLASHN